ncbi:MAG: hypothetical protein ACXWCZ_10450 [Flavisolibacter sp.]
MKLFDKISILVLAVMAAIMAGFDLLIEAFRYRKPDNLDVGEYYFFGKN